MHCYWAQRGTNSFASSLSGYPPAGRRSVGFPNCCSSLLQHPWRYLAPLAPHRLHTHPTSQMIIGSHSHWGLRPDMSPQPEVNGAQGVIYLMCVSLLEGLIAWSLLLDLSVCRVYLECLTNSTAKAPICIQSTSSYGVLHPFHCPLHFSLVIPHLVTSGSVAGISLNCLGP